MRLRTTILIAYLLLLAAAFSGCTGPSEQGPPLTPVVYDDLDSALDSGKPVVVYFNEDWCSGCKDQGPIIQDITLTAGDNAAVVVLDRNQNPDVALEYGIDAAPNMVILDAQGQVVQTGYAGHDELKVVLEGL